MLNFLSRAEVDELCDGLICQFYGEKRFSCVDIDRFVREGLRCPVRYEAFAEEDLDKIGFCGDGSSPLRVYRNGIPETIIFPKETIVLERYLLREEEQNRRRFTLAHEAGHVLAARMASASSAHFHQSHDTDRVYALEDLRERLSIAEWQANTLAAALLMPRFLVKRELKQHTGNGCLPVYGERVFCLKEKIVLREISRTLGVSYTALVIRLDNLGALHHRPLSEYISKELGLGGDIHDFRC